MSRTDKDAPDWVRALHDPNAIVHHGWRCEHSHFGMARPATARPCDLDVPRFGGVTSSCFRWVRDRTRWYTGASPSPERLHLNYYGPERAAVRDHLRDAVRDYNAHGETEVDPPTRQTRHSDWYGGYWD